MEVLWHFWQQRRADEPLEAIVTASDLLKRLRHDRAVYGLGNYPRSPRALFYWLAGLERRGFIRREDPVLLRNGRGHIRARLSTIRPGRAAILWMKTKYDDAKTAVSRSIAQKFAWRIQKLYRSLIKKERAVDKTIHSAAAKPKPTKKTAALRRPVHQVTRRANASARKSAGQKRTARKGRRRATARAVRRKRTKRVPG